MRKFKFASEVMLVMAAVALGLSLLIAGISEEAGDAAFLALMQLNALLIGICFVGVFLAFTKNQTVRILGNGMSVVAFGVSLSCALTTLVALSADNTTKAAETTVEQTSLGAIIVIVAAALLLARYAFLLVDYIINKNSSLAENPNDNIKVRRIKEWKQLLDDGIITQEEFEEKRTQILGIKEKTEVKE